MLLYNSPVSGNCYKVRLLLAHLGIPYERRDLDVVDRSDRPEVLGGLNPDLRVPTLVLDDGRPLAESGAILWYFGDGTRFVPDGAYERAKVLQWLSFENDYLQNSIGSLRFWKLTGKQRPSELVEGKTATALRCLRILDEALARAEFLVGGRYTIADMACFAYTHLAEDAGLPLRDYPHVLAWIGRVRAQPGFLERVHPYSVDPHSGAELP